MPGLTRKSPEVSVPRSSKISTTTCQRIVFEEFDRKQETATVTVQSDATQRKLWTALTGHIVNKAPICPSALYADMALTIADYIYKELRPEAPEVGMNVCAVEVHKPLIAQVPPSEDGQHFQMEGVADLKKGEVALTIRSVTWDGKTTQEHGHGTVKYEDRSQWLDEWKTKEYLVQGQIFSLEQKLAAGTTHKLLRGMAYKLFTALVDYAPEYQGMDEVILDAEEKQAVATIHFKTGEADGDFFCSPYFIDNMCHLSGFLVNAADLSDDPLVYISHGWKSMRIARLPEKEKQYRTYVKMLPYPNNISSGDVYVLEGEEIVAVFEECKFQGLPRRLMNVLLPSAPKAQVKMAKGKGKEKVKV